MVGKRAGALHAPSGFASLGPSARPIGKPGNRQRDDASVGTDAYGGRRHASPGHRVNLGRVNQEACRPGADLRGPSG
jgi:hypothetical protein